MKNFIEGDVTYSYEYEAEFSAKFIGYDKKHQPEFQAKHRDGKFSSYKVSTFGRHSIYNGFAAYTAGKVFGVKESDIKNALKSFAPQSSKRMQVENINGVTIINDAYNSNPESVIMGLKTLIDLNTKGNIHIVLADMLELGKSSKKEHSEIGKLVSEFGFQNLYTYGAEAFYISKAAKDIKSNFHFEDREILSDILASQLRKGDVVYVKGSRGMKLEEVINLTKTKFNA